jgi:hypothetical protein
MKDLRIRRTLDGDKSDEFFKTAFIERLQRPNVVSPDESWITEILYTTFNEFFFLSQVYRRILPPLEIYRMIETKAR